VLLAYTHPAFTHTHANSNQTNENAFLGLCSTGRCQHFSSSRKTTWWLRFFHCDWLTENQRLSCTS